jgi:hypothetical protein
LLHFRVRLACVRHAASVDSEPGSNSHVKFVGCRLARLKGSRSGNATQLTRGRFIGSALFNPFLLKVVHRQSPSHGLPTPVDRLTRCHPLTLIVRRRSQADALELHRDGLCVLARLSSFQRTDGSAPVTPYPTSAHSHRPGAPGRPCRLSAAACLGEPCEVTIAFSPCQPLNCSAEQILDRG